MYLSSISLSLISFIIVGLGGRFYGRVVSAYLSTFLIFTSFCCSVLIWYEVCLSCAPVSLHLYTWLNFGFCVINIGFLFDFLTCTMLFVITSISFFVHLYSIGYLWNDPFLTRFMAYLSLFTFWMLILVSADNFLQMFIGWEGVGLCSYLLINFWFTRFLANKAALKAMIINRIADVFFILAIVMLFFFSKTTDYIVIFHLIPYVGFLNFDIFIFKGMELINILLLIGAFGKSAQIGLHVWLPDAMEGPTPVSALLHAATMVTAGVFLVIRCAPLLNIRQKYY